MSGSSINNEEMLLPNGEQFNTSLNRDSRPMDARLSDRGPHYSRPFQVDEDDSTHGGRLSIASGLEHYRIDED